MPLLGLAVKAGMKAAGHSAKKFLLHESKKKRKEGLKKIAKRGSKKRTSPTRGDVIKAKDRVPKRQPSAKTSQDKRKGMQRMIGTGIVGGTAVEIQRRKKKSKMKSDVIMQGGK